MNTLATIRQSKRLSLITLITNTGDFISLFVVLKLIQHTSQSITIASFSVGIRAIGIALAAISFSAVRTALPLRSIIIYSQVIAAILTLTLVVLGTGTLEHSTTMIFAVYLAVSVLNQWFTIARDTMTEQLGAAHEKRSIIANLLDGYFTAQVVGSVISFVCLVYLPITVPILLDALSFFLAASIAINLAPETAHARYNPLTAITVIFRTSGLREIFLLRSLGFWLPIGLFNYFRFSVINQHYGLDIVNSVWVDVAIGAGGMVAVRLLNFRGSALFGALKDYQITIAALLIMAATRIAFINLPSIYLGLAVVFLAGIASALNAISTRSIRAKLSDSVSAHRGNIIALELVTGQIAAFLVAGLSTYLSTHFGMTYVTGMISSCGLLILLAGAHGTRSVRI